MASIRFRSPRSRDSWGALDQLQRDMMRAFDRLGTGVGPARGTPFPPVNLYESDGGYVLTAEIPGVKSEDLDVSVEGERVTIGGKRAIQYPTDGSTSLHRRERQAGVFRRSFNLPEPADPEKTEAICRHGILMVRIPKAESAQPRRISVRAS
jgi:HSP20 family protein